MRLHVILRNALADGVAASEVELRRGVPLVGRRSIPPCSFGTVLLNATTIGIHDSKLKRCTSVALLSR